MQQFEVKLDELLVKKAPFQIPDSARQILVKALPWLVLLGGFLILLSAWGLYQAVSVADRWAGLANELGAAWGTGYVEPVSVSPLLWLSLIILVIEGVLYFVAFPALQTYQKKGWNILYWLALINAAQGLVHTIAYANVYFNVGQLLMSLLGTVIGLYLLFQVRAYYTGEKKVTTTPVAGTTMTVPKETPVAPAPKPAAEKPETKTPETKA
ncbi:MAG TPA: hypothetical protein VJM32_02625 [Candidatus Saccharimonadales bacterium]|nr:hypothetical protein [Candidatus Saccharimonadales bacterium]